MVKKTKTTEVTEWSNRIDPKHKFEIVYTARDEQQAENYPIKNSEILLRLAEAGMKAGFDIEASGGDLPSVMLKHNQNPVEYQERIEKLAEKHGVKSEFLLRNANIVGYQPLSRNDIRYTLENYAPNMDRARNFSHSNFLPTLLAVGEMAQAMGLENQNEFTPSYTAHKKENGEYELRAVFTDEQAIEHFQAVASSGAKRSGFKIADGVMPPEDLYRLTKKLKEPGVLPKDFVLVCHTHDTNKIGKAQYEAFIAAGGNVVHCSHPAFADNFSQPNIDHFVQHYPEQITNLRKNEYSQFIEEGFAVAKECNFKKTDLDKMLDRHSQEYISRLNKRHPEILAEKFPDMIPKKAIEAHKERLVDLIHKSGVPGGGVNNARVRAEKAGWTGLRSIAKFSKSDFLEDYLTTLIEVKPKIGGNQYVTPNYKNGDEISYVMLQNPSTTDPFVRKASYDGLRPEFIPARRIFLGEYDPPQGQLDPVLLQNVKDQELTYLMNSHRESGGGKDVIGDNAYKLFTGGEAKQALLDVSDKINASYKITRERDMLAKQAEYLEGFKDSKDKFYSARKQAVKGRLKNLEKDGVSLEEYTSLMKKGDEGGKITGLVKEMIEADPVLKDVLVHYPETVGKALRAVTFLECSVIEILPDRLKAVEATVKERQSPLKDDRRVKLYPENQAVALALMAREEDPASPKVSHCLGQDIVRKQFSEKRRGGGGVAIANAAEPSMAR